MGFVAVPVTLFMTARMLMVVTLSMLVAVRMFVPSMADSMRRTSMKSRTNHFVPPYTAPPG